MTDTIHDYLYALRRFQQGETAALDKYRPAPAAPKPAPEARQEPAVHQPRQGGLGL